MQEQKQNKSYSASRDVQRRLGRGAPGRAEGD
jgi:hypothetical protein